MRTGCEVLEVRLEAAAWPESGRDGGGRAKSIPCRTLISTLPVGAARGAAAALAPRRILAAASGLTHRGLLTVGLSGGPSPRFCPAGWFTFTAATFHRLSEPGLVGRRTSFPKATPS